MRPLQILKGLRDRYETASPCSLYRMKRCIQAVELSTRYISGRCLPDKAIDVIDEAGARVRLKNMTPPPDLAEFEAKVEKLQAGKR